MTMEDGANFNYHVLGWVFTVLAIRVEQKANRKTTFVTGSTVL